MVEECKDAETLSEATAKIGGKEFAHIYDSKIRASKMLAAKAKELGFKFNAETKQYEKIQDKSVAAE